MAEPQIVRYVRSAHLGRHSARIHGLLWLCSLGAGFVVRTALPVDGGYVAR